MEDGDTQQEPDFTTDPHFKAISGHPTPSSTARLPKLSLGTLGAMPSQDYLPNSSSLVSPATTLSSYSFSSSLTLSSPFSTLSPISAFSPAAWDESSSIDVDITSAQSPVSPSLPRLFTRFPNFNSYAYHPEPSPSYYSNSDSSHYPPPPTGPSVTWVNREISSTPSRELTATYEDDAQLSYSRTSHSYSHGTPPPRRLFSSILSKYMAEDLVDDEHRNASHDTEVELLSPATPYSPNPLSPF
ncbi:hypothetical protein Clacol_005622 [Clathrus columnatus]|uniref:Uncharacterized protein n=1 Tax=Clathrus columnatus TaxID=1419009 RepID=A0AAV5ADX7_9AGAM|nr:hypothetical protein Clacol_005622 [Clathrus columnatus]